MMSTAEPMTARGAHYTALLETLDNHGATKLHAIEREQLLEAADALLFGEDASRIVVSYPAANGGKIEAICKAAGAPYPRL